MPERFRLTRKRSAPLSLTGAGLRPAPPRRALTPQERRAAVAACREPVKDGLVLPSAGEAVLGKAVHTEA